MTPSITTLTLRLEHLEHSSTVGVTGNVWFETDDCAFPGKHWSDFAETITGWWVNALIEVYRSNNRWHEKTLLFMDGPYEAVVRNGSPVSIHFKHHGGTVNSFTISLSAFTREIIAARRHLLHQAVAAGWKPSALADLELCDWLTSLVQQTHLQQKRPVK